MMKHIVLSLAVVLTLAGVSDLAGATQTSRRRKPSRRVTNPVRRSAASSTPRISVPQTDDVEVVSTDDERRTTTTTTQSAGTGARRRNQTTANQNAGQTIQQLTAEINTLRGELKSVRDEQRTLVDLERLGRAEQRAENFRAQMLTLDEKQAGVQSRLEQLELDLQPENIEIRAASVGSTRPELVRTQIRQQLENERTRLQNQQTTLATSRARLEQAIASADTEVERLRTLVNEPANAQNNASPQTNATPPPQPQLTDSLNNNSDAPIIIDSTNSSNTNNGGSNQLPPLD